MSDTTFYQGLWRFPDFPTYLNNWITPNILKDLETIFEGSKERWIKDGEPVHGRGDFILATVLFALMDHLGAFLATSESYSLEANENIARIALRMESIKRVNLIVAHFGRNALIHGAWPQTLCLMDDNDWGFGLSISANPYEDTHLLYVKSYIIPNLGMHDTTIKTLKLAINVHILRSELQDFILSGEFSRHVQPSVYHKMRSISIASCDLKKDIHDIMDMRKGRRIFSKRDSLIQQIEKLRRKAINLNIWT